MNTETPITFKYQTGGSLSANDPTYVQRQADQDLYNLLRQGEFCYVLNSRQMGKSSLRVRTMQRLQQDGYACAEVDLSGIGSKLSEEKWYYGLVHRLMRSFAIPSEVNWRSWWKEHNDLSPVQRLGELFEEILLPSVPQNLVIFLDEIDSVLSFDFSTDDFFALIRYCYNQRVNNPNYNRLRFCLLGVATPSELIQDKKRTPFNIGRGIELTGLTEAEAIPVLSQGLASVVEHREQLLTEVLYWTGGQPFLTQKLCRLIVDNSDSFLSNGNITEEFASFVRSQIIEDWESKDQPEHLKTIRDRVIKRSEKRTSHLLELYQQIWQNGEVKAQSNLDYSELQLSGLVVNRQGKFIVYNLIYREIFNKKWIEVELKILRPYAEAFRGWIASGEQDKSRLLRGKALEEATIWAEGKELSYQDQQFLAASRKQKIQEETEELERKAQLEREMRDREAAEKREAILRESLRVKKETERVQLLVDLFSELLRKREKEKGEEVLKIILAGLSLLKEEPNLKQALFLNTIALIYQYQARLKEGRLDDKKYTDAKNCIQESLYILEQNQMYDNSLEQAKILVHAYCTNAQLYQLKQQLPAAAHYYRKAIHILNVEGTNLLNQGIPILQESQFQPPSKIISLTLWETAYLQYMKLLGERAKVRFRSALKSLQYANLENLLRLNRWRDADLQTSRLIVIEANAEERGYLIPTEIETFSCKTLSEIDQNWIKYSSGRFGFSVQKRIFVETGNQLKPDKYNEKSYLKFLEAVGWMRKDRQGENKFLTYSQLTFDVETSRDGHLPLDVLEAGGIVEILSRIAYCKL